jgi:DNA-binding NarL/FixJ family response regulator
VIVAEELPGMEGIEVIRHLHEQCPGVCSVLLADEDTPDLRAAARLAGATTCVRRDRELHPLLETIAGLPLPPDVRSPVASEPPPATDAAE